MTKPSQPLFPQSMLKVLHPTSSFDLFISNPVQLSYSWPGVVNLLEIQEIISIRIANHNLADWAGILSVCIENQKY